MYKFGDKKYFKKERLKILQAAVKLWADIRKAGNIPYYSSAAPTWDSPGTPECMQVKLSEPLKKVGVIKWGQLSVGAVLISWKEFKTLTI